MCPGIVPVKVLGKGSGRVLETYALLDNGSEVTWHELLVKERGFDGERFEFSLTGIISSEIVDRKLVDLVVKSIDDSIEATAGGNVASMR